MDNFTDAQFDCYDVEQTRGRRDRETRQGETGTHSSRPARVYTRARQQLSRSAQRCARTRASEWWVTLWRSRHILDTRLRQSRGAASGARYDDGGGDIPGEEHEHGADYPGDSDYYGGDSVAGGGGQKIVSLHRPAPRGGRDLLYYCCLRKRAARARFAHAGRPPRPTPLAPRLHAPPRPARSAAGSSAPPRPAPLAPRPATVHHIIIASCLASSAHGRWRAC